MTYKFVTRNDLISVWPIGEDLEAKELVNRLINERDAYREVAIKYRTLWGELSEPVGKYAEMPGIVDSEVASTHELSGI